MKKRLFSLFTSLIMVISLVSVLPTMAVNARTSGDYEYEIFDDGTVEIISYNGSATNLNIPSTIAGRKVTYIYDYAFAGNKKLSSVNISDNVEYLGEGAFYNCSSLKSVKLPNNAKFNTILDSTFEKCTDLISINIPATVQSIDDYVFCDCDNLRNISIPYSVSQIGAYAFLGTAWLENKIKINPLVTVNNVLVDGRLCTGNITIPNNVNIIAKYAFFGCENIKRVTIHEAVYIIDDYAFSDCTKLSSIQIPDSLIDFGKDVFYNTPWLANKQKSNPMVIINNVLIDGSKCKGNVQIPNKVVEIVEETFDYNDNITSVDIPNSVVNIGEYAFYGCNNLQKVKLPNNIMYIDNSTFQGCCSLKNITIPNSVEYIGELAFGDCYNLKSISIPKKVESIGNLAFGYVYSYYDEDENINYYDPLDNFTIKCYKGTEGEAYAKENGFKYQLLDVTSPSNITKASFKSSANTVKMSWNKVSGATGYRVYQYNTSTKKWKAVANIKNTNYTFKNLKSGTTYKFTVRAYKNQGGKTYLSPKYTTFTTSTTPSTVSFKVTAGSKKATVKWNKVTGATGYKVYYKTSKNGSWKCLKTTNNKTTSYTKTGLTKGKTYYFTVKAYRTVSGKTYNGSYATKSIKVK